MTTTNPMQSMMEEGIKDAFGAAFDHAVHPILVRLTEIETLLATVSAQQQQLLSFVSGLNDDIQKVRNGGGFIGKLLGG